MRFLAMFGVLFGIYMPDATADCWVVTNLSGYGARASDNYDFDKDKITNGVFHVSIDGKDGNVTSVGKSVMAGELLYMSISSDTLIGLYSDESVTMLETWSITNDKKALYTKVINSNDNKWSASRSMVGDVVGKCGRK
ncbi:hypothetical protein [Aeromonas hydrophila]|uniref:hypothetical protein n=1 Tax=Aeromonas hydrophila TaxID=644 RepID=UPI001A90C199|nr:hypothetical protein [Aeromonas hydrophila]MBQ4667579.1 hypothetical protein [Aeromonas hydrophila]MBQ4714058.1 hypothetical protein [Aeromonas hydrophila]MBW3822474.1 hypothetical protein [Aeromonas hydrophila]MBW5269294.1 hypothetical protein [Aeromonas hydrophila]QSR52595.1 hypothetical protein GO458_15095 [Aeromonas hydrophila]